MASLLWAARSIGPLSAHRLGGREPNTGEAENGSKRAAHENVGKAAVLRRKLRHGASSNLVAQDHLEHGRIMPRRPGSRCGIRHTAKQ